MNNLKLWSCCFLFSAYFYESSFCFHDWGKEVGVGGTTRSRRKRRKVCLFADLIKNCIFLCVYSESCDVIRLHLWEERSSAKVLLCCSLYYKYRWKPDCAYTIKGAKDRGRTDSFLFVRSCTGEKRSFTFLSVNVIYEKGDKKLLMSLWLNNNFTWFKWR